MAVAAAPRRTEAGGGALLTPGVKIAPADFKPVPNGKAPFIAERLAYFDTLYANAQAKAEAEGEGKAETSVEVAVLTRKSDDPESVPEVKTVQAVAGKTRPLDLIKQLKLSKAGFIAAKVSYDDPAIMASVSAAAPDGLEDASDDESDLESVDGDADDNAENKDPSSGRKFITWDLNRALLGSCMLEFVTFESAEGRHVFWHSSAHLLGLCIEQVFGGLVTVGPALSEGFYYDFYGGSELTVQPSHYEALSACASKFGKSEHTFQRLDVTKDELLELFKYNPFKVEFIKSKIPEGGMSTVYRCGPFVDLCRGPHVTALDVVGKSDAFKVMKHSAAYWLAHADGDSLQRVYGLSFPNSKQLKEHMARVEEAKRRDHRNLGNNLSLFFFEPNYSPGSAFWTPTGYKLYSSLVDLVKGEYKYRGFQEVHTPNLFTSDLFKTSGHWQNYKDCMFTLEVEGKEWGLKPMNCPSHCLIFKHLNPSYRQLPLRLADFGVLHRNEFSGSLSGLTRVRRFQQDDAHIFTPLDRLGQEVADALNFDFFIYELMGYKWQLVLATRPENFMGDPKLWDHAEAALAEALRKSGQPWKINRGDGAFYGPKIDLQLFDCMGRRHQCGTVQCDFQLPLRFNLTYKAKDEAKEEAQESQGEAQDKVSDADLAAATKAAAAEEAAAAAKAAEAADAGEAGEAGEAGGAGSAGAADASAAGGASCCKKIVLGGSMEEPLKPGYERPVMIHRAILGSVERHAAVALEHFGGKLPFWLSPRQAIVCPVSPKFARYGEYLMKILRERGYHVDLDASNTTINKKVRAATVLCWNFILVVGANEEDNLTVTLRNRDDPKNQSTLTIKEMLDLFADLKDVTRREAALKQLPVYHKEQSSE